MTNTNTDDLFIFSDDQKIDNDFLFFDDSSETKKEDTIISFDDNSLNEDIKEEKKDESLVDFGFSFDSKEEVSKKEISSAAVVEENSELKQKESKLKQKEVLDNFDFSFIEDKVKQEETGVISQTQKEAGDFSFAGSNEPQEVYSSEVAESMATTVGDLNAILEEAISKLQIRKTNLSSLKEHKTLDIEKLNKQIEDLKLQVEELQLEVKSFEIEDEKITSNITALQAMKLGESANNKDLKKTTKKTT